MEVRIRLQRIKPAKSRYHYRIVAMNRNRGRDGRHLEILGHYDPAKKPAMVSVDLAKIDKWVSRGATMSETVRSIVKKNKK